MSDREIIGQRPDGYIAFMEDLHEGLMDNEGHNIISPELGYRSISDFIDGVAIGFRLDHKPNEGGWGLLNEKGEKITEFKYWYIEPFAGRNLYLVSITPGLRKNLMWNDGTLVFKENYQDFYKKSYRNGYVIASNTVRKTKTTPTRYLKGLLHVRGEVLLPVEYEAIGWMKYFDDVLYTKREGHFGYVRALYGAQVGVEYDVMMPGMWLGVKKTICDGCIYSRNIDFEGRGCGRLFTKSFRDRNLKGKCEFRKTSLNEPSLFERQAIERWKNIARVNDPLREYRQLVKDFIKEHLNGDINQLAKYDLRQLEDKGRYADKAGHAHNVYRTELVQAIAALVFKDIAPKDVMFDKKSGKPNLMPAPLLKEDLWGTQVGSRFTLLSQFRLADEAEISQKITPCAKLCNTIGNLYIHPASLDEYRHSHAHGRFLIDYTFADLHKALTGGKPSPQMKKAVGGAREFFDLYRGYDGWKKLMEQWLTMDLVDYYYNPEPFFEEVTLTTYMPADTYLRAVKRCIDTCYEIIPRRAEEIIKRLKDAVI